MNVGELVELVGRRWAILEKLRERKYYVGELAKELGKTLPEISKNLNELEKSGLLQCEQGEGRRKYCYTSDLANRILGALVEASQSKPKEKLEEWKINELLDILEDQGLSESLRGSYARMFHDFCREHPEVVIIHENTQRLFLRVLTEPVCYKPAGELMRALANILPTALKDEKWGCWVLEKLYPALVKNAEDKQASEEIRSHAVSKVAQIASLSGETPLRHRAEKTLLEIWFSEDAGKNSKLEDELRQQLACLCSKHLFEAVRAKAKDPELKGKAEILLQALGECLVPK
jgi:DNA-binding transcriptional ArsR family regulator